MVNVNTPTVSTPPKLLDQVRDKIRVKHYSIRTETQYLQWIKRFIYFHGKRHPKGMGAWDIEAFLTHLAVVGKVAASTLNLVKVKVLHAEDLAQGYGEVYFPFALDKKYPKAGHAAYLAPFVRDASAGKRIRHPHRAGAARPFGCFHHDDLHSRAE